MARGNLKVVPQMRKKREVKEQIKKAGMCRVPRCRRYVDGRDGFPRGVLKRGMCSRCSASRSYWRGKLRKDPEAMEKRQTQLTFLVGRFAWLFDEVGDEE